MIGLTQFLRSHRKVVKNYLRYGDGDYDPVEYVILDDLKLIYIVNSKVACTSIKATIGKLYGVTHQEDKAQDIHDDDKLKRIFGRLPAEYADYASFSFVRNPFSRLVSCYVDRVLHDPSLPAKAYQFRKYPFPVKPNMSFEEFIHVICKIPDYLADRHFKNQSYTIFHNGAMKPDFIGNLESISSDWKNLAHKYALPDELERLNKSEKKEKKPDYRSYYDRETLDLVYNKYRDDIVNFGYEDIAEQLLTYINSKLN